MAENLSLTSSVFSDGGLIPEKYTCDGDNKLSPPLSVSGVPQGAKSLALVMDDPDIPKEVKEKYGIEVFDHWAVFNMPAETKDIPEGGPLMGTTGLNGTGESGYTGPCPPKEYEPTEHRYVFTLYALSESLSFLAPPTKQQVLDMLEPCLISQAQLVGRYARK